MARATITGDPEQLSKLVYPISTLPGACKEHCYRKIEGARTRGVDVDKATKALLELVAKGRFGHPLTRSSQ